MPRFSWDYPQRFRQAIADLQEFLRTTSDNEVLQYLNPFPERGEVHPTTSSEELDAARPIAKRRPPESDAPKGVSHELATALWPEWERYTYLPQNLRDNPLSPIAVAKRFPLSEYYDLRWAVPYLPTFLTAVSNVQYKLGKFCLDRILGRFDKMLAYRQLFSSCLPLPDYAGRYHQDSEFGRLRLEGPNPVMIERLVSQADIDTRFPQLTDQLLRRAMDDASLSVSTAISENRLYICDYEINQSSLLPPNPQLNRDSRWRAKYLPAPRVVFFEEDHSTARRLIPVAITLDQADAAAPNPLYIRSKTRQWSYAKTFAQSADLNTQVLSSHIFRCHFVAEPFAMATPRQLTPNHPLHILLEPHLRYTLFVNDQAFNLLKVRGKVFDNIYAGTIAETRELMIQSYHKWTFRDLAPARDFERRGVQQYPVNYPYRDDISLYWPVIERFVRTYLSIYYTNDHAIVTDEQLQNWVAELVDPNRGNVHGLLQGSKLATLDELVEIISILLFTAGPQHASVHFPQTEYFTFIPAYAGAPYRPPAANPDDLPPQELLEALPPIERAAEQFQTNQIGNYRFDKFGYYDAYRLGRVPEAQPAITKLHADLDSIDATIRTRNQDRDQPYTYLLPQNVPNSINI